jgi:hypothetical protein
MYFIRISRFIYSVWYYPRFHITAVGLGKYVLRVDTGHTSTIGFWCVRLCRYVVGSKSFRPDQLFKVTEMKQLYHFSVQSP